jgi:hypothetical protein
MKNTKHTPAPWRWTKVDYSKNFYNYREYEGAPFDALWSDSTNQPVFVAQDASSYAASCDFKNDNDAKLIAAAPELLDLLQDILNENDRSEPDCPLNGVCLSQDMRERVINTIAKAKGE